MGNLKRIVEESMMNLNNQNPDDSDFDVGSTIRIEVDGEPAIIFYNNGNNLGISLSPKLAFNKTLVKQASPKEAKVWINILTNRQTNKSSSWSGWNHEELIVMGFKPSV